MSLPFARPELLRHPGPADALRVDAHRADALRRIQHLAPDSSILDALWEPLERTGRTAGKAELVGGTFGHLRYCIPAHCPDGSRVATFSDPIEDRRPVSLVLASATLGLRDGARWMHCHALWVDADGVVRAGHLLPETEIGDPPPRAVVDALSGVRLESAPDAETNLPIFHHRPEGAATVQTPTGTREVLVARVKPNEDIVQAVEKLCLARDFRAALVRASVGSLVGARLRVADRVIEVPGPAVEVIALVGEVRTDARGVPAATLTATLVGESGQVFGGELISGANPVAITYELFLEPIPAGEEAR
ncbi:PPC domain-containing DNA-binding protein [Saccharopolyspora sp. NPDC050389]|uniref:PPC domain-containing DNA-binding protein n=1 Tax=Saccharopolyspora sp. NPDC050389 TaxID=3155516 RepID=UPI0033EA91ED